MTAFIAAAAVISAAAWPQLRSWYLQWRTQLEEIPLAGAIVSYRDFGEGAPAVVIISGVAVPKDSYLGLQRRLSKTTRVISYDRPGIGESTPNSQPRTLDYIDKDLKELLRALDVPPPYILVGHSFGGYVIRYYAAQHPQEVAGLIFLDQPHEDWFAYIRKTWSREEVDAYFRWWTPENPDYTGVSIEELQAYETNCRMARDVGMRRDIPVLMFTTSNPGHFRKSPAGKEEDLRNWVAMQTSLLAEVEDQRQLVDVTIGHWPHQDKAEWVAGEISAFIDKVRVKREAAVTGLNPLSRSPSSPRKEATATSP